MPTEPIDVVRSILAAWGEERSAAEWIHPDMKYVNPPDAVESGTVTGRGAFRRVFDVYPRFAIEPRRFVEAGENVVVIARVRGTTESGFEMDSGQTHVWTVRDGRAVRFAWFNDPDEALRSVGIEP